MQPTLVVDTNQKLARLIARLLQERTVAVDTESNSLFAHRERLCLVQLSSRHGDWLVDPLAPGIDLALLAPLFADMAITKVFHDAEFDILTLKRAWPFEIAGVFDTKVVAASLGLASVGLAPLLRDLLQVDLDKRFQRSDWGRRPLSQEQLEYARRDTHYLLALAAQLKEQLQAAGPPHVLEVAAECRRLEALVPEPRPFTGDDFVRIRGVEQLTPLARRVMRELFVMRDRLAAQRDRPPFKILANDMLLALAMATPASWTELHGVAAVPQKLRERYGESILSTVEKALHMRPITKLPRATRNGDGTDLLTPPQRAIYENLRAWRKKVASARRTDPALVLSRPRMLELAQLKQRPRDVDALVGSGLVEPWRAQLYGAAILAAFEHAGRRRRAAHDEGGSPVDVQGVGETADPDEAQPEAPRGDESMRESASGAAAIGASARGGVGRTAAARGDRQRAEDAAASPPAKSAARQPHRDPRGDAADSTSQAAAADAGRSRSRRQRARQRKRQRRRGGGGGGGSTGGGGRSSGS